MADAFSCTLKAVPSRLKHGTHSGAMECTLKAAQTSRSKLKHGTHSDLKAALKTMHSKLKAALKAIVCAASPNATKVTCSRRAE